MSDAIPQEVLSEHFGELMDKRHLVSAVFTTYRFDPGFFEQEVLPVFLDTSLNLGVSIRLIQLETAMRHIKGSVSVYYDAGGLEEEGAGSARLDVRRVALRHKTGVFHPKNVLALVEDDDADEDGNRRRWLLAACMSANLTRAGWWENVEVCHVEELGEGMRTRLRDELLKFAQLLKRLSPPETNHAALDDVIAFLRDTAQIEHRTSSKVLHPHFYRGAEMLVDFLDATAGKYLRNTYLEVISPYFDSHGRSGPLEQLIERFEPRQVRVLLPREADGTAECSRKLYDWVSDLERVEWGKLPRDITQMGKASDAADRRVHAKVYRFFNLKPKWEILFVGSANLTTAGHSTGGNVETGFLVEVEPARNLDFWLLPDRSRPKEFTENPDKGEESVQAGLPLNARYDWSDGTACVYWDADGESEDLQFSSRGVHLFKIAALPSRRWVRLVDEQAACLRTFLEFTSFLTVTDAHGASGVILVQEEGMVHKPSLLLQLSVADILKYWSLLTVEQRVAFIETQGDKIAASGLGADLLAVNRATASHDTLFDRFAGYFHAFGCLERAVDEALADGNSSEAVCRLFGKKFDSLGNLLQRVLDERKPDDPVDRYVIGLCARQLKGRAKEGGTWSGLWSEHAAEARDLEAMLERTQELRGEVAAENQDELQPFLNWFEKWFLRRAEPVEKAT